MGARISERALEVPGSQEVAERGEVERCVDEARAAIGAGSDVLLACDASLEGVLAAVGIGYLAHAPEDRARLCRADSCQPRLGEVVVGPLDVGEEAVVALARRVFDGFERAISRGCSRLKGGSCPARCSGQCMRRVVLACASDEPEMPEVVHRYLRLGFSVGGRLRTSHADPRVVALEALAKRTSNEMEHMRQFVRFSHLSDGSWLAVFCPTANAVPLVASHFVRRMGTERFCLLDPTHRVAALHEQGSRDFELVRLDEGLARELSERDDYANDEKYVRALWKRFYDGVGLEGRGVDERGYDLRAHFMYKRFWASLPELDPRSDDPGTYVPDAYRGDPHLEAG